MKGPPHLQRAANCAPQLLASERAAFGCPWSITEQLLEPVRSFTVSTARSSLLCIWGEGAPSDSLDTATALMQGVGGLGKAPASAKQAGEQEQLVRLEYTGPKEALNMPGE